MNHDTLIRHLTSYSETMIKDLKPDHARSYLRGCIQVWREAYGADVADQMTAIIRKRLNDTRAAGAA